MNEGGSKVGVLHFHGPFTWSEYYQCTDEISTLTDDQLMNICGLEWVSRLDANHSAVIDKLSTISYNGPGGTTFASGAFLTAYDEFSSAASVNGRNRVTILLTDGHPIDRRNTREAADRLKDAGIGIIVAALDVDRKYAQFAHTNASGALI